jgi:hypothetical protein
MSTRKHALLMYVPLYFEGKHFQKLAEVGDWVLATRSQEGKLENLPTA